MSATLIPYPEYLDPPKTMSESAHRSAEHAIYTPKRALAEEHFLRMGHDAAAKAECETCTLIVAGTSKDTGRTA